MGTACSTHGKDERCKNEWVGHVARMGRTRSAHNMFGWKT